MAIMVRCEGCHEDFDKADTSVLLYEQKVQGKSAYFCAECNPHFYDYRDDINQMWARIDKEKFKEKEEIRKKWFISTKKTPVKVEKKEVTKSNAKTVIENDLAEVSHGETTETEGELSR